MDCRSKQLLMLSRRWRWNGKASIFGTLKACWVPHYSAPYIPGDARKLSQAQDSNNCYRPTISKTEHALIIDEIHLLISCQWRARFRHGFHQILSYLVSRQDYERINIQIACSKFLCLQASKVHFIRRSRIECSSRCNIADSDASSKYKCRALSRVSLGQ